MKCKKVQKRLIELEALTPGEADHVRTCPVCTGMQQDVQALLSLSSFAGQLQTPEVLQLSTRVQAWRVLQKRRHISRVRQLLDALFRPVQLPLSLNTFLAGLALCLTLFLFYALVQDLPQFICTLLAVVLIQNALMLLLAPVLFMHLQQKGRTIRLSD